MRLFIEGEPFPDNYIENCLKYGDLPPTDRADISNYYFMVLHNTEGKLAGFFDLYHGYPDDDTVWIGMFLIREELQGKSFGFEAVNSICKECKRSGWKSIGLGVHLKNWKGLRFWSKNGFNEILGIYGDKEYSTHTFSIIGLKHEL